MIGALLLGSVQQIVTVTISNEMNVLVVGVLLVVFVVLAPDGILGLVQERDYGRAAPDECRDVSKHFGGFTALLGREHRRSRRASASA